MPETVPIPPGLLAQVKQVRKNTVSKRSKTVYKSSYRRFLIWLAQYDITVFSQSFLEKLGSVANLTDKEMRLKRLKLRKFTESNPYLPSFSLKCLPQKHLFPGCYLYTLLQASG